MDLIRRETNRARRLVKREHNIILNTLEDFAKRSKFIEIHYKHSILETLFVQVDFTKENKIVREMVEYLKEFCDYVSLEKNGSMWFRNFDDLVEEENEDLWEKAKFQICLAKM